MATPSMAKRFGGKRYVWATAEDTKAAATRQAKSLRSHSAVKGARVVKEPKSAKGPARYHIYARY